MKKVASKLRCQPPIYIGTAAQKGFSRNQNHGYFIQLAVPKKEPLCRLAPLSLCTLSFAQRAQRPLRQTKPQTGKQDKYVCIYNISDMYAYVTYKICVYIYIYRIPVSKLYIYIYTRYYITVDSIANTAKLK